MSKLKLWQQHPSWEDAEKAWEISSQNAASTHPLKVLNRLPENMPGITSETAKNLKWKSLKWMVKKDTDRKILLSFLKHPIRYGKAFIRSLLKQKPYIRDGDFFLYGLKNIIEFEELLKDKDAIFVTGFSYCHKPFECPSGRFTDQCMHDLQNPVCRQCFIGKCVHTLPDDKVTWLMIPTIHYVGGKIFDIVHANPGKKILFLISACELTLEMFGDFGNMVGIQGVGVRLDGRICNTMKAFELSEDGVKPGLTVVREPTKERVLNLLRNRL